MRPSFHRSFSASLVCTLLLGCGGFSNDPFLRGVIRGSLLGAGAGSMVSVIGQPELSVTPTAAEAAELAAHPERAWAFELREVPRGAAELLLLVSSERAERLSVEVRGGDVTQLLPRTGQPAARVIVELEAPSHQRLSHAGVAIDGVGVHRDVVSGEEREEGTVQFALPTGCYTLSVSAAGLATQRLETCVQAGALSWNEVRFPQPDGAPGHEGCVVSGCVHEYRCETSSGRCKDD